MKMRKVLSFILVLAILLPIFAATPVNAVVPKPITASYAYEPFEIQKQDKWEKEKIGGKGTLSDCGCGIFALYNAVLALTGKTMNITEIAQWAFENDGHDGFDAYNVDRTLCRAGEQCIIGKRNKLTII